jgi:hypothetical protein
VPYQQVVLPDGGDYFGKYYIPCCDRVSSFTEGDVIIQFKDDHIEIVSGLQCYFCRAVFVNDERAPEWGTVKNVHFFAPGSA